MRSALPPVFQANNHNVVPIYVNSVGIPIRGPQLSGGDQELISNLEKEKGRSGPRERPKAGL